MKSIKIKVSRLLPFLAIAISSFSSFAQSLDVSTSKKDACAGANNGSITVTVLNSTSTVGPYSYLIFGIVNSNGPYTGSLTKGVPTTIPNLPPDNYLVSVSDGDGSVSNYSTFALISNTNPGISLPSPTITNNSSCSSPDGQIAIAPTGGSGSYTYSWTGPGSFTSTSQNLTGLSGGSYTVAIGDNNANCSFTSSPITVTDPSPIAYNVATSTPSICLGSGGTVTLSNSEGSNVSYQVFKGGVLDASVPAQTGTNGMLTFAIPASDLTPAATYNFTIQATNGSCTPAFMNGTGSITVNSLPSTSSITGNASVCSNTTGVAYSVTNSAGSTYAWTITGGTQASGGTTNSITVDWGAAGAGNVSVVETNAAGCPGTAVNLPVTIKASPNTSSITGNATVCANTNGVAYSVTNTAGSTYTWTITGGVKASGGTTHAITVNWGAAGAGNVKVVETNSAGCVGTAVNLPVTINAKPSTSAISGSASVCENTNGIAYSVTNTAGSTYAWTITGGAQASGGSTNSITVNWGSAGAGNVKVVETNAAGCTGSAVNKPITINAAPTTSAITGNALVCANTNGASYSVTNTAGSTYAWTITGGTQASGTNTNSITVNWGAAGAGNVQVIETNSAGCAGAPVSKPVTIDAPNTSSISGNASVCANTNGVAYSVTNTVGSTYAWTITGGTQASGGTTSSITVNWGAAGAGNVKVVETNSNSCVGTAVNLPVTISAVPATSAITGNASTCANATGVSYSVTNTAGSTYVWVITGGTQSTGGTTNSITVDWGAAGAGNVQVTETNAAGCIGTPVSKPVTINPSPSTSSITGNASVCANTNGVSYSVTNTAGSTYAWTITGGIQASGANTNSITVNWGAAGAGNVKVVETNSSGCSGTPVNLPVTINAVPSTSSITGSASVCANTNGVAYSVTNTAGSTYAWTITGGTQASGTNTNSITVNWGAAGAGNVQVIETNSACTGSPVNLPVIINALPSTSPITGNASVCANTNGVAYSVNNTAGSTYAWTITGGAQASGTNTNSITVNWGAAGAGNVQVIETNAAACVGSPVSLPVTISTPNTSSITGNAAVCANTNGVAYSVTNTAGSTYAWTITGGVQASGTNTNSITVNWGAAGAGNVKVVETSAGGCVGTAVNLPVTINSAPVTSPITGSASVCANSNGVTYSVTNNIGSTYTWTISGGAQASGTNTNSITVNWGAAGAGSVQVVEFNGCTGAPVNLPVTINALPSTSAITGNATVCENTTGVTYSVTNTPGSTYTWTITGGVQSGGTNTNSITVDWGVAGAGNVSVVETNAAGCQGSAVNKPVTLNGTPTASNAGPTQTICSNASATLAANTPIVGGGVWSVTSGPSLSTAQFSSTTNPAATFTPAGGAGAYVLTWTINNAPCAPSTSSVTINVDGAPTSSNAGPDQGVCGVSTTLAGNTPVTGTGTWSIISGSGGSIGAVNNPASTFSGTAGTAYTLRWSITNGVCTASTDDVNIVFSAPPTSANAGSDQGLCGTSTNLAGNTPASGSGSWSIISGGGGSVTTPTSPTSAFTGVAGTTYQLRWTISNGACPASTDDVMVTFDAPPTTAAAGGDQSVCGTSATLAGNTPVTGTGSWSIMSGAGGTIPTPTSPTSTFTGVAGNTYTLRWTISSGSCTPSTDDVIIIFNVAPTTADAGLDQDLCNVTSTTLAGNTPIIGTGNWSVVSGTATITTPSSPTSGVTGLTTGTATLRWTITNGTCPASTDDVNINVAAPATIAAAGSDQTVCGPATLAANTPAVGTGAWTVITGAGGSLSNASSPTSTFTGVGGVTYTLRWTITSGTCAPSTDDVNITFDINSPTPSNAGPDQSVCGTSATLAANTPAVGTGAWSIVSGTGGVIANATDPSSGFTGTQGNSYTLRWTITSGACTPSTDDVIITFDQTPTTAAAGPDQTLCNTNVALAANTPAVGTGAWSIVSGAGGSFANAADPLSGFTGVQGTTYQLRWTISNGTCTASTDDVMITIDQSPTTAAAGSDQSACNTTVTLAANSPTTGTGAWTIISGAGGSFVDATNPTTDFNGTQGTIYVLRWTISNGTCTPSTDDVQITLDQAPTTAAAGLDQTPCGPTSLAANTPVIGTGLWSVVSGAGGSFSDTTSPTSTFSGTAGTTYVLRWTISNGTCTPSTDDVQIQFDPNTPTTANAGSDQSACSTSVVLAANTPIVGTGAWSVVSGAGGSFANAADPLSGFTGTQGTVYTLRWTITSVGGCAPSTDDVVITLDQSPTVAAAGADKSGCNTTVALSGNTPVVGTGAWSIISGAGGSIANSSNPNSNFTGVSGNTYTLRWTISNGSCAASSDDVNITINPAGSCGLTNCFAFTSINHSEVRPSCTGNDDGQITITVSGGTQPYAVTLYDSVSNPGTPKTFGPNIGVGPFVFGTLSPSLNYQYIVQDAAGNVCPGTVSLQIQTTVQATASGFVDSPCFNQPNGQATVTVTSGGNAPYYYSLDNGATWTSFTSPYTITNLMPAAAPYTILVADDPTDQCPAQVSVTILNSVSDILIADIQADATCANNDGSIQITSVSGGTGPYTFEFDGQSQSGLSYPGLSAGNHTFKVTDANTCTKTFPFIIKSPGYVDFDVQVIDPTCVGSGGDGKINVTVNTSGNFDIGITTDPNNDPAVFEFQGRSNLNTPVQFDSLSQGSYRIVVKPNGALCSSDTSVVMNGGPVGVDFSFNSSDFLCYETKGLLKLFSFKGASAVDYKYELIRSGVITKSDIISPNQALDTVRISGLDSGVYHIKVVQLQAVCPDSIYSALKSFTVIGPSKVSFDTISVVRNASQYSFATGSMVISLKNTNAPAYHLKLHMLSSELPEQNNSHNIFDSQAIDPDSTHTKDPIVFTAKDLYAGLYQLSIRDSVGCSRSYELTIDLSSEIFIPNIFTPNNDGKNDNFEILNLPPNSHILITNRWGKEILSSGTFKPGTDLGSSIIWSGGAESDGIYYYTLRTTSKTYSGWVELRR